MVSYISTFSRNTDKHDYPKTTVWENSMLWDLILRTRDYSFLNPRYTGNKTLEFVLVEIQSSRCALRNIDTLELNLGKHEQTH